MEWRDHRTSLMFLSHWFFLVFSDSVCPRSSGSGGSRAHGAPSTTPSPPSTTSAPVFHQGFATPVVLCPPGPPLTVRHRQSATEGRGTDHRHLRRDGSHHDVLRGCWWRREVARQRRPAISWPRKGERRRARRRRLQLRRHFFWRQQRVRLRRRRPRRSISSRSPRTSAQIVIDSWHLSSARRVESHRRTCFAVSTTRRTRRRLD